MIDLNIRELGIGLAFKSMETLACTYTHRRASSIMSYLQSATASHQLLIGIAIWENVKCIESSRDQELFENDEIYLTTTQ